MTHSMENRKSYKKSENNQKEHNQKKKKKKLKTHHLNLTIQIVQEMNKNFHMKENRCWLHNIYNQTHLKTKAAKSTAPLNCSREREGWTPTRYTVL